MEPTSATDQDPEFDLELPPIAPPSDLAIPRTTKPRFGRKRTWDPTETVNNSSDPAVFSSDDYNTTSVEDYATKRRRKHQWKGTWWGERVKRFSMSSNGYGAPPGGLSGESRSQREFRRNYDSGVFMGSEGTEDSLDEEFLEEVKQRQRDSDSPALLLNGQKISEDVQPSLVGEIQARNLNATATPVIRSSDFEEVRARVQQCLEDGKETVDLSSLWIASPILPNDLLSPLRFFTKIPSIQEPPTSQEAYESLEPHLRIFLSNNQFTNVPSELFNLPALSVLSLRQNRLIEVPPAIGKLTDLVELNIGSNQIEVLPWEILQMMKTSTGNLKKFSPFPNPFRRFSDHEMIQPKRRKGKKLAGGKILHIWTAAGETSIAKQVAKSSVSFFHTNGTPRRQPPAVLSSTSINRIPSLLELALRTTTKLPYFTDLAAEVQAIPIQQDESSAPENLKELLDRASKVFEAGGQTCPTCGKAFIIPRAEWVEWWDLLPQDLLSASSEAGLKGRFRNSTTTDEDAGPNDDEDMYDDDEEVSEEEDDTDNGVGAGGSNSIGQGSQPLLNNDQKRRPLANVVPFRKRVCSWACIE